MKRTLFIAVSAALLAGCSVQGDIKPAATSRSEFEDAFYKGVELKVGSNPEGYREYRIFSQGASGFTPQSGVKRNAMKRAQAFCSQKNGRVRVITEHRASGARILGNMPRVELVFVCVPSGAYDGESPKNSSREKQESTQALDRYGNLERLGELRDKGILSDEEFEQEKRRILSSEGS